MSRATELKGVRDTIDELREGVEELERRLACHLETEYELHREVQRDLRGIARAWSCTHCHMVDFEGNMEKHGQGGLYRHKTCRLQAEGAEVCAHCGGKGEVKKVARKVAKKKGKGDE